MIGQIMSSISQSISACLVWMSNVYENISGVVTFIICAFVIITLVRYLIKPLVGYASSDMVKAVRGKNKKGSKGGKKGGKKGG